MNNNKLGFLPPYVSWLTIALALGTIITFFAVSDQSVQYATRMGFGGGMMEYADTKAVPSSAGGVPMMSDGVTSVPSIGIMNPDYYPYPYPNSDVPVSDTREFLKVYYNASMLTRNVLSLTRRVEESVRGYGGRIDQESSSQKYGYLSFVLPQSKYNEFRAELESLVGSRFLTLNISSQNLLSQKVSIEEQQKQGVETQDATLLANVATVNGTVSIQWISFWDIALLYLPGYWIPTIFVVLALLSFTRDRRRRDF